jgi:hypothetical protein
MKSPWQDEKGKKIGGIENFVDITSQQEQEKIFQDKLEELEKVNKLMIGRELKMVELKKKIQKSEHL